MTTDISTIANALKTAPHHRIGITINPPSPPKSPAVAIVTARELGAFTYTLKLAEDFWPQATSFALVGADADHPTGTQNLPPDFTRLQDPEILVTFDGGTGARPGDSQPAGLGQAIAGSDARESADAIQQGEQAGVIDRRTVRQNQLNQGPGGSYNQDGADVQT